MQFVIQLNSTSHAVISLTNNNKIDLHGFNSIEGREMFLEIDIQQISDPAFGENYKFRPNRFHQRIIKLTLRLTEKLSLFRIREKGRFIVSTLNPGKDFCDKPKKKFQ